MQVHPWCRDVVPQDAFDIDVDNISLGVPRPFLEYSEPGEQHFRLEYRNPPGLAMGINARVWLTFRHLSPVVEVTGFVAWSSRHDPRWEREFNHIRLRTKHPLALDYSEPDGHPSAGKLPQSRDADGSWSYYLADRVGFVEGSAYPFVGRMLCGPSPAELQEINPFALPHGPEGQILQDLKNLTAAADGWAHGFSDKWNGQLLAGRTIGAGDPAVCLIDRTPGSIFDERPSGLAKEPGRSGGQGDFAFVKSHRALLHGQARWVHGGLRTALSECLRGYLHFEANGDRLSTNRPISTVSWNSTVHWHTGLSPYQLDKLGPRTTVANRGWQTADEEHDSANVFAAAYALTGNPVLRTIMQHRAEMDACEVRFIKDWGFGAPRAFGRRAQRMANFYTLAETNSDERQIWAQQLQQLALRCERTWRGGKAGGPIKILDYQLDPRVEIFGPDGKPLPGVKWWEHGLVVVGCVCAAEAGFEDYKRIGGAVARSMVKYAYRKRGSQWFVPDADYYPVPGQPQHPDLPQVTTVAEEGFSHPEFDQLATHSTIEVWIFPAVLAFLRWFGPTDPDHARAMEIAKDYVRRYGKLNDEWWSINPQVYEILSP